MGCFDQARQADVKAYIDKIYLDRFPEKTNLNLLPNACNDSDRVELGLKQKMIVAVPATTAVRPQLQNWKKRVWLSLLNQQNQHP